MWTSLGPCADASVAFRVFFYGHRCALLRLTPPPAAILGCGALIFQMRRHHLTLSAGRHPAIKALSSSIVSKDDRGNSSRTPLQLPLSLFLIHSKPRARGHRQQACFCAEVAGPVASMAKRPALSRGNTRGGILCYQCVPIPCNPEFPSSRCGRASCWLTMPSITREQAGYQKFPSRMAALMGNDRS
jgi:hypothetical protein